MAFLESVLEPPAYGWKNELGELSKPTASQSFKEFFLRLNVFKNKKNWLSFMSWMLIVALAPFLFLFIFKIFYHSTPDRCLCLQHDHYGYAWYHLAPSLLHPWRLYFPQ